MSLIIGYIDGVPRKEFMKLKFELDGLFETVWYREGTVRIKSDKQHSTEINEIFYRLSECIEEGKNGRLWYFGKRNNEDFVGIIFMGYQKCEWKEYPKHHSPDWWVTGK